jgi:hypothetical protein
MLADIQSDANNAVIPLASINKRAVFYGADITG